jgi:NAD(P)-dependent dehydrogenase (short-subunit alcohol dehydrogenase family)
MNWALITGAKRALVRAVSAELSSHGWSVTGEDALGMQANGPEALVKAAHKAAAGKLGGVIYCGDADYGDESALLAQAFAASLSEDQRGALVVSAAFTAEDHYSFMAPKQGLLTTTELLARAMAPLLRVNAVAPDFKRAPSPESIARAIRFLLENPAITGQTLFL